MHQALHSLPSLMCGIKPVQKDILQTFYGMADISRKFLFFLNFNLDIS